MERDNCVGIEVLFICSFGVLVSREGRFEGQGGSNC